MKHYIFSTPNFVNYFLPLFVCGHVAPNVILTYSSAMYEKLPNFGMAARIPNGRIQMFTSRGHHYHRVNRVSPPSVRIISSKPSTRRLCVKLGITLLKTLKLYDGECRTPPSMHPVNNNNNNLDKGCGGREESCCHFVFSDHYQWQSQNIYLYETGKRINQISVIIAVVHVIITVTRNIVE